MSSRPYSPYRVALTGGVASGKTTVATLFAALGAPVIDTDQIARDLVVPGSPLLAHIVAAFGTRILLPDGSMDRRALREIVFEDAQARARLEGLLHPAIAAETDHRSSRLRNPYVLVAIPLLVERGGRTRFDRVLLVDCEESLQLRRLQMRDSSTARTAQAMIQAQAPRAARRAIADDIILNDGDIAALAPQVETLHFMYLALAGAAARPARR
ncbi:MAG: dephospho-CoA kinase [Steroidobacteraceae bacterium]